jgi:O-antigen ligase
MAERAATSRWATVTEWVLTGLLAVNLVWTTLCLGGYRPETMVVTSALTGVLLLVHLLRRAFVADDVAGLHPAGWWLLPFLIYAAANVLWVTPVRWLGWHDWLWWAQLIAIFWVVLNDITRVATRQVLLLTLAVLGFVAVVMAAYQAFVRPDWLMLGRVQAEQFNGRSSGPFGIPNSLAALLLLLLPPAVMLTVRRGASLTQRLLAGYLAAVFLLGLILTVSRGAWLGLAVALMVWPLLAGGRTWGRRLMLTGAAMVTVTVAGWVIYSAVPTMRLRFDALVQESGERTRPIMWHGAWKLFEENPVWGSGAGSYNIAFEKHRPEHYQLDSRWAHNDYLNTLSDYGAVGFILFFGACAVIVLMVVRRPKPVSSLPVAAWSKNPRLHQAMALGLLAFALQLLVDFHLKIPALAMALATVAGLLSQYDRVAKTRSMPSRIGFGVAALLLMVGLVGFAQPHYRAEALRYSSRQAINRLADQDLTSYREVLMPALIALQRAVEIDEGNAQGWADLSYATALKAHVEPAHTRQYGLDAASHAERALSLSTVVPEFWLRQGVALDMQGRWHEAGRSFTRALALAPNNARTWYYQAYHLSLRPAHHGQARSALGISLRLDPSYQPAQLLRQQLATR